MTWATILKQLRDLGYFGAESVEAVRRSLALRAAEQCITTSSDSNTAPVQTGGN